LDAATGLDRINLCQQEVNVSAVAHQQATDEATKLSAAFAATVAQAQDQIEVLAGLQSRLIGDARHDGVHRRGGERSVDIGRRVGHGAWGFSLC
jgi:hypothetical protein